MPELPPRAVLRLEPHMIPELKAAFVDAVQQLRPKLDDLSVKGRIPEPWMTDPVSTTISTNYHRDAMDGPESAYGRLRAYELELTKVIDTLAAMEAEYRRTEGENAALWGGLA